MARRPVHEKHGISQSFKQNLTQYNVGGAHGAIDYATPVGTPVIAPEDGIIEHADWCWALPGGPNDWAVRDFQIKAPVGVTNVGGGIMVKLRNPINSRWWKAHLDRTDKNPGDRVRKGEIIGYTGNTGSSTGPHIHVALLPAQPIWTNGYFGGIDPQPYLDEPYQVAGTAPAPAPPKPSPTPPPPTGTGSAAGAVINFVDASEHNTVASVKAVATDAIILRTGWGIGGDDELFDQHLATTRARKLRYGTYHYSYLHINDARAEARYYASRIPADAEFACLDYEDGIKQASDVRPAVVAAFADEFKKHSKKPLWLYTWGWVAEMINPAPFDGKLWLPDFGTNQIFKNYAPSVTFPAVKGWKVIANQYGDHFQPATGGQFDINKHLGGMWPTSAAPAPITKDWFDMADKNTLKDALREVIAEPKILAAIANKVLDTPIKVLGNDPDGKPYTGTTTLRRETGYGPFRGYRDRRIEAHGKLNGESLAIVEKALEGERLKSLLSPTSGITAEELAQALLRGMFVTPHQNQEN